MVFCEWLLSLNMMASRCIHSVASISISFPLMAELCSIVCGYHNLSIHQWTLGLVPPFGYSE